MTFLNKEDEKFMAIALNQAKIALKKGEVPVGAIILSKDKIILAKGRNKVESTNLQTNHAEVVAIEKACKKIKNWRLDNCTIYVTLEPCLMCMGLINLTRIKRVVWGVSSPIFGHNIDKQGDTDLYKSHIKGIKSEVLSEKITILLKQFFKNKRIK